MNTEAANAKNAFKRFWSLKDPWVLYNRYTDESSESCAINTRQTLKLENKS